jgi:hypothetical protein
MSGDGSSERRPIDSLIDVSSKALAVLGTGVGVLGFTTLVGGAIFYAQMSAVGLPSDQIVSALPRSTLLVVGARFIIPLLAGLWLVLVVLGFGESWALSAADSKRPAIRRWGKRRPLKWARFFRFVGIALLLVIGAWFIIADLGRTSSSVFIWLLLFVLLAVSTIAVWAVGIVGMPRFLVFATAASVAAAVFATALGTTLASVAPAVRAVAIARTDGTSVAGVYAAATSNDVLVGEICAQHQGSTRGNKLSGALIVVPRSDIKRMVVTTNGSLLDALNREPTLVEAVSGGNPPTSNLCTDILPSRLEELGRAPNTRHQGIPGVLQGP